MLEQKTFAGIAVSRLNRNYLFEDRIEKIYFFLEKHLTFIIAVMHRSSFLFDKNLLMSVPAFPLS
jgi:hypothetical protein